MSRWPIPADGHRPCGSNARTYPLVALAVAFSAIGTLCDTLYDTRYDTSRTHRTYADGQVAGRDGKAVDQQGHVSRCGDRARH